MPEDHILLRSPSVDALYKTAGQLASMHASLRDGRVKQACCLPHSQSAGGSTGTTDPRGVLLGTFAHTATAPSSCQPSWSAVKRACAGYCTSICLVIGPVACTSACWILSLPADL